MRQTTKWSVRRALMAVMVSVLLLGLVLSGCNSGAQPASSGDAAPSGSSGSSGSEGAAAPAPAKEDNKEPIRIGHTIPLTGSLAVYGKYFKNGTDLAVEQINADGGIDGRPLEIIYEDHKGDPAAGVSALQKLISKDKVNVVFLSFTGVSMAQIPLGTQNEIVMLTGSVTFPGFAAASEWTVQNSISVKGEALNMSAYLKEQKIGAVSVIQENSEVGKIYKDELIADLGDQVKVNTVEAFDLKGTDFRGQVTKAAANNPDGIVVYSTGQEMPLIFKQIRENGYTGTIYANSTAETSTTLEVAGDAAEGVIYTFNTLDDSKPHVKKFIDDYKAKFNEDPELFGAQHYEMVMILADILKQGKESPKDILEAFKQVENFQGITGDITFDESRISIKELQIKVIKDGKFQALEK